MPCKIHWDRSTTAHLMSIVLVKESLDLGSHWKATALIVVPLSYCMINRGSYSIASRMACMAAATSAPYLLVRGCTQAHFDTTSMQQKRYLVPSLATRYLLQSTRSHCSYFPRPETMGCHWRCGSDGPEHHMIFLISQGLPKDRPCGKVFAQACPHIGDSG